MSIRRTHVSPTVTREGGAVGGERYDHPAFGVAVLTNPHGNRGEALFGSDAGHTSTMCIAIHRASLKRTNCHDYIHAGDLLCEFEMSHAQFAEFITGTGRGSGTPCTLTHVSTGPLEVIPNIAKVDTKYDIHRREISESVKHHTQALQERVQALEALLASDKFSKTELKKIASELRRHCEQMPGNLDFTIRSAEEALEAATTAARIDVEAFIGATARRLGFERLEDIAKLSLPNAGSGLQE